MFEAFVEAAGQLVEAKVRLYGLGRGHVEPEAVAEGARQRLWEIFDRSDIGGTRDADGHVVQDEGHRRNLELTFDEDGKVIDGDERGRVEPLDLDLDADFDGGGEILTDDDLDFDLSPEGALVEEKAPRTGHTVDDEEPIPALLDATVATNLELVERYAELERYCGQLEQKNRELVKVTQNVVHDLNRPLSAIRLMLSSMQKGYAGELGDTAKMAVDNGLAAAYQMERLIRDLLDSSRLDFDGVRLDFSDVDLGILVARILDGMRYELEEHDVGIRVEPLPTVRCDEWALTRVLGNLLGNAVQYRHPDRPPRVWVSAVEDVDRHVIVVRDNGIGIPEKDLAKLFQRFVRGSNTGGISGTGLGLHITKEIMLGHGGDAWVESVEGEGTAFHLALPHAPVQPPHSSVSDVDRSGEWTTTTPTPRTMTRTACSSTKAVATTTTRRDLPVPAPSFRHAPGRYGTGGGPGRRRRPASGTSARART